MWSKLCHREKKKKDLGLTVVFDEVLASEIYTQSRFAVKNGTVNHKLFEYARLVLLL